MPRNRKSEHSVPNSSLSKDFFHLDRSDYLAIAGIAFAAALVRLAFSLELLPLIHLDSDSYFEIAQRLWETNEFGDLTRRPPLYSLILWLTGLTPKIGLWGAIILQHLAGILTVVLFYLLPRRMLFPRFRGVAILSGLLCALISAPIILEHSILSEPLYTALIGTGKLDCARLAAAGKTTERNLVWRTAGPRHDDAPHRRGHLSPSGPY